MENNANDFNAGATDPSAGIPDSGDNGANDGQPSGNPGNQQGQQPDPRDAQIKALNKALVEARRAANQSPQQQPTDPNGQQDPNDPALAYGNAIVVAEGDLRSKLEPILDLYPELTDAEKSQIRRNPWAFVDRNNFLSLNVGNSLIDIEEHIAKIAEGKATVEGEANNGQAAATTPATVNPNQPTGDPGAAQNNPMEDWAMPMEELEKKVGGIKRSNAARN